MGRHRVKRLEQGKIDRIDIPLKTLESINKDRKYLGLSPVLVKMRKCLLCEIDFESFGSGNRLCGHCR
jgi:hypothetical protein